MRFVVNTKQMTDAELCSERNGIDRVVLMKNAACGCLCSLKKRLGELSGLSFALICGSGNNGGDGVELARLLTEEGAETAVILMNGMPATETAKACASLHPIKLKTVPASDGERAYKLLRKADVIIDCVFGTGFHGELPALSADLFDYAKDCEGLSISIDIPSGVNGNSGAVSEHSFKPDITLVLAALKTGLLNYPCCDFCGETEIVDIGIDDKCYKEYDGVFTDDSIFEKLPIRAKHSNKGTFGKLLNVAGCENYIGAAVLSSKAALRAGAGLVTLASVGEVVRAAAVSVPECVFLRMRDDGEAFTKKDIQALCGAAERASAISVGCGMGNCDRTRKTVELLLKNGKCPVILDADGINSVSDNINVLKDNDRPIVLTPHPGEFSRLLGISVKDVQANRLELARRFAADNGTVLLLKGADTIIAAPDGRVYVNSSGNNALAKAGCGDVLTGIIGSLAAQGIEAFYAAVLGAYIHGKAADRLVEAFSAASVLAGDVIEALKHVMP